MSFENIGDIIEGELPDSAYSHRPWWANRTEGRGAQNLAWQTVGWETRSVNMELDEVTFVRVKQPLRNQVRNQEPLIAGQPLSIAQAKAGLAAHFGVPEEAIEINIRG